MHRSNVTLRSGEFTWPYKACCAIAAGKDVMDVPAYCRVCWRKIKDEYRSLISELPEGSYKTKEQAKADAIDKLCSGVSLGFATSPSFLLVVAALSMTLLGMHNPLDSE
jgi:hypothetical protein